ncbi:hypothetical protein [Paraburkholderia sediminicola]
MHLPTPLDEHVVEIVNHDFGNVRRLEMLSQRHQRFEKHPDRALFERAQLEQGIFGRFSHAAIVQAGKARSRPKERPNKGAFASNATQRRANMSLPIQRRRIRARSQFVDRRHSPGSSTG